MILRGKSNYLLTQAVLVVTRYYCKTEFVDNLLLCTV